MRKGKKNPFLFLLQKLREEKGHIDMLIILFIAFLGISIIMTSVQPFITRANMVSLSKKVVEEVEFNGIVNSDTNKYVKRLIKEYGLEDNDIKYEFKGAIRAGGKIQLREEFTFEIEGKQPLQFANFGEKINITLPIKKNLTGQSQVYYKPDDL